MDVLALKSPHKTKNYWFYFVYAQCCQKFYQKYEYSRTLMAQTRLDRWCEFDPSMGSSDTGSDNFKGVHMYFMFTMDTDQSC